MLGSLGRASPLPRRRWAAGWVLALLGPASLGALLATTRSAHSTATELMLFLSLSVVVALVGGLAPALVAAVLGSAVLNYWFTPPRYTWKIDQPEQALALVVFVLVAVAVSSVVDLAARRREQADRSRAESETLSLLAAAVLRGEDSVAAVLGRLRETFDLPGAALEERSGADGAWHLVAVSGEVTPHSDEALDVSPDLRLLLRTRGLTDDDRRVVTAFASHAAVVLERERLRERAARTHRLEQGIAIRTALLAAVSHDLRTPLASIKAATSSLLLKDVDWSAEDREELLWTVSAGADRLQSLIDNLLDLSRLQAGVVQPLLSPVALDEVLAPALTSVPTDAVTIEVPDDLPLVLTDAGLLERVIANLVENAVRHATGAAQVCVRAVLADGHVDVLVVDHGVGITDADKLRVFEPFRRLDDSTTRGGNGLGLAVARGFTTAVGGTLTARDTPGGGLTMAVRLPVA